MDPRYQGVGTTLSHYRLCAPLGRGAMGTVYRAVDERLQRDVAVKVLAADLSDAQTYRTLVDEACVLSKLNHPNIAAVLDIDSADGRAFLVLEYVPGLTLEELAAGMPLPAKEVVRLGVQMAGALAAAHGAGVVHRDIKPANIKLTPAGELKLLDFGIARLQSDTNAPVSDTTRRESGLLGTLPFMSPEQLRGEQVDARSDIFSAGAVLYQLATGCRPFPQRQLACLVDAVLNQDPIAPRTINAGVPRSLDRVILTALRKRASDRFESAAVMAAALETSTRTVRRPWRLPSALRWWSTAVMSGRRRMTEIV